MRRIHIITAIATIILVAAVVAGVIIQIFSPHSLTDTAFDIIVFVVSVSSIAIAVIAQVSSYQDRKSFTKMARELKVIDSEVGAERAIDQTMRAELDELLTIDRKIYSRLNKKAKGVKESKHKV
jgi:hypothetical protein